MIRLVSFTGGLKKLEALRESVYLYNSFTLINQMKI